MTHVVRQPAGIVITGLSNPLVQATARTVQFAVANAEKRRKPSDPSEHRLTREALEKTLDWVQARSRNERTPLDKLAAEQLDLLVGAGSIDRLKKIDEALLAAAVSRAEEPLIIAMQVAVINNVAVRNCALAISENYGATKTKGMLTIGQLSAAWDELQFAHNPDFHPSLAFSRASSRRDFNSDNVQALRVYMTLGLGGLTNHGSLEGHGFELHRVFQLPLLPSVALPGGKAFAKQPEDKQREILRDNIAAYEERFVNTGFDRIYVLGEDKQLYVALHDEGPMRGLRQGARLVFTDPSKFLGLDAIPQSAEVLKVVDVNNTLREASFGFWGRTFASWGEALNNIFRSASEKPVDTITALSNNLKPDAKAPAAGAGGATPWFAAAGLAGLAAAMPGPGALTTFLGVGAVVVGVGATGLSIWSLVRTGKNIGPFLDATGHVVNAKAIRSDDV